MFTVGLTGGAASGKSIAADAFSALGVPVLNADAVAREVVLAGTPALQRIRETFGSGFLQPDGQLDRRRLREHIFADPAARKLLEDITHPAIRDHLIAWCDAQSAAYCVLDVPILIESGMDTLVDRVLVIDAPEALQTQRLTQRDGIPESLARQMILAQATREQRLARADDVIVNAATVPDLRDAVARLHAVYRELSGTP